jgi:murein DD-endopeptidase MepM/ murein hydrolase activator NlpD
MPARPRTDRAPRSSGRIAASLAASLLIGGAWLSAQGPTPDQGRRNALVRLEPGRTTAQSLRLTGVSAGDAEEAARAIGPAAGPGDLLEVALARPGAESGPARLAAVTLPLRAARPVTFLRGYDGALRLADRPAPPAAVVTVAEGQIQGSLYESAERAGADPELMEQAASLFAKRLDLARDLAPGDRFRLVFRRTVTPAGDTVATGDLLCAEIASRDRITRLYAFDDGGRTIFLDPTAAAAGGLLLRTPVAGARITSGYGMRLHPIFGYTRMHQGVDFAAPTGTPVVAAGDGVVLEAGPRAGYGNWLRIRHADGWDTAYAHLSGYAAGLRPGLAVRQGQVVGFVGESGEATGPHLHYEVWRGGVRVDPATVPGPTGPVLSGRALAQFSAQKARIDALLATALPSRDPTRNAGLDGLRPRETVDPAALRLSPEA